MWEKKELFYKNINNNIIFRNKIFNSCIVIFRLTLLNISHRSKFRQSINISFLFVTLLIVKLLDYLDKVLKLNLF